MENPEVDVAELARRLEAGTPVIDVRQPEEYVAGHVPGAVLIPLSEVLERLAEVPSVGEVMVICKSGGRSRSAAEAMRASGIDAVNVAGGTDAWVAAGSPVATGEAPG